jgi:cold shock CspA family protein
MHGLIKTFIPEKQYGFIQGDDGKSYFFHASAFGSAQHLNDICDGVIVSFEPQATPKGYRAEHCLLMGYQPLNHYTVPDDFPTSKTNKIKNWDILEIGDWIVNGSSRGSVSEAKQALINLAKLAGGNALIDVIYHQSTGSEPETGKGTHYYTVHNFYGRLVTVAKLSVKGKYTVTDSLGVNQRAEVTKQRFVDSTCNSAKEAKRKKYFLWLISGFIVLALFATGNGLYSVPVIWLGFTLGHLFHAINHDDWLEKSTHIEQKELPEHWKEAPFI